MRSKAMAFAGLTFAALEPLEAGMRIDGLAGVANEIDSAPRGASTSTPSASTTIEGVPRSQAAPPAAQPTEKPFDFFRWLGELFSGRAQSSGNRSKTFDFGLILAKIFEAIAEALDVFAQDSPPLAAGSRAASADLRESHTIARGGQLSEVPEIGASLIGTGVSESAALKAGASDHGSVTTKYGSATGEAHASASLYARAEAYARGGTTGAEAAAKAEAGAEVEAGASGSAQLGGGLASTEGSAVARAGATGDVSARVVATYEPLSVVARASGGGFTGARAEFEAQGGLGGLRVGVHAGVYAGAGARADFSAGFSDGKFKFGFGIGVSVGVGFFFELNFEIDLKPIAKGLASFFHSLADQIGGGTSAITHAAIDGAVASLSERLAALASAAAASLAEAMQNSSEPQSAPNEVPPAKKSHEPWIVAPTSA